MRSIVRRVVLQGLSFAVGNNDGKIVFYHDIFKSNKCYDHATSFPLFFSHIQEAKRIGYKHVSGLPVEKKSFHICFDDGFRGILECRRELDSLGIKPTVYIAVDLIGKPGFLTKNEILDLQDEGYDFQSHTWSHEYLPMYDGLALKHELDDSKKWLSDFLQKDVDQVCFPRGLFTQRVYEASLEAGYKYLVSSIPGSINEGVMPHVLPRNLIQNYSAKEFGYVLKGGLSCFKGKYLKRHFVEG